MGRIYIRDNMWYVDYMTADGVRVRHKAGPNKAVAEKILNKKLTLVAENKHLDVKRAVKIRLSEFIQEYTELHLKANRPTWWKSERKNLSHLQRYFGDRYLFEIRIPDVERMKIDHRVKYSPASVNKLLGCLKAMFNKAIEWGRFEGLNPVTKVKMFKADNQRTRYLEKEEIARLLASCEGYTRDIIEFAINTGMRRSEIFNLKWHEVDLRQGIIYLLKTKNGEQREVPINKTVEAILYRVRKSPDSPYVFSLDGVGPVKEIKKSFYTALRKAGIQNFRFHDLRHTFASQLVMAGVDLNTVRDLLGHKDIKMTLRYSHLSCHHKKQAVSALDRLNGTQLAQDDPQEVLTDCIPETCVV